MIKIQRSTMILRNRIFPVSCQSIGRVFYCNNHSGVQHQQHKPSRLRLKRRLKKGATRMSPNDPYIFHPLVRTINPIEQALYLSKSVKYEGELPTDLFNGRISDEILLDVCKSAEAMRFSNVEASDVVRGQDSRELFSNAIKAVWTHASSFPGLQEQSVTCQSDLKVHWNRFGYNMQVSGRLGLLFSSERPMRNFSTESEVMETSDIQAHCDEGIISPVFELSQNKSRAILDSGFYNDICPHPHMLFIEKNNWELSHLIAQGLMFSFGRLLERAISTQNTCLGYTLTSPLSMKTVVCNKKYMGLLCYQLNTLDLESNKGIKNQLWFKTTPMPLFNQRTTGITEKNKLGFHSLIALMLYGADNCDKPTFNV